jgi:hypothetical protein
MFALVLVWPVEINLAGVILACKSDDDDDDNDVDNDDDA